MPAVKVKRSDLKPGEILCQHCTGTCCRYFSLPIETPTTWEDYDNLRWYLCHGRVALFVEGETWYLVVHGDCQYLQPDNRCGIYDDRPLICRKYTTDECEYDNDFLFEKYFDSPDQIWEYAEAILPPRPQDADDAPKKTRLPILNARS